MLNNTQMLVRNHDLLPFLWKSHLLLRYKTLTAIQSLYTNVCTFLSDNALMTVDESHCISEAKVIVRVTNARAILQFCGGLKFVVTVCIASTLLYQ